jgi:hypothetical protein
MGDTKSKNLKINEEKRAFNSKWKEAYFCAEQAGKPQLQVIEVSKEYNVNRHYNTLHEEKFDKCEGATRLAMLSDLKLKLSKEKSLFLKSAAKERENLTASCAVCLELVKQKIRKYFHVPLWLMINEKL